MCTEKDAASPLFDPLMHLLHRIYIKHMSQQISSYILVSNLNHQSEVLLVTVVFYHNDRMDVK
jgi:hypothetical protein